jgi:hypothetical protein
MADDSESRGLRLDDEDWLWLKREAKSKRWSVNYLVRVMIWRERGRKGLPPDRRSTRWKK